MLFLVCCVVDPNGKAFDNFSEDAKVHLCASGMLVVMPTTSAFEGAFFPSAPGGSRRAASSHGQYRVFRSLVTFSISEKYSP